MNKKLALNGLGSFSVVSEKPPTGEARVQRGKKRALGGQRRAMVGSKRDGASEAKAG
jgi:hypothetical protein